MRKRIFEIIEKSQGDDRLSQIYDVFMIVVIIASLIPLGFKTESSFFYILDKTEEKDTFVAEKSRCKRRNDPEGPRYRRP